jgi:hypothetical protein
VEIRKIGGSEGGAEKEKFPLCQGGEDSAYFINFTEMKWREKLCKKWLVINENRHIEK